MNPANVPISQTVNQKVYEFLDRGHPTASYSPLSHAAYNQHYHNTGVPIVFDLGTYEFRAGFANEQPIKHSQNQSHNQSNDDRAPRLRVRPLVGKIKGYVKQSDQSGEQSGGQTIKVANQMDSNEATKLRARTPFDQSNNQACNLLSYYETLEHLFDYIFLSLGFGSNNQSFHRPNQPINQLINQSIDRAINHPLIFTEPVYQPNFPRSRVSELAFECYQAPLISYGVDCLFAWKWNVDNSIDHSTQSNYQSASKLSDKDGLIVSSGHSFTHVIPVVKGTPVVASAARISVAARASQKLFETDLMNEYPHHFQANKPPVKPSKPSNDQSGDQTNNQPLDLSLNPSRIQELMERFCLFADDYDDELKKIAVWDVNNQSITQLIIQSRKQSTKQSNSQSRNHIIDLSMDTTDQSNNQSSNQSIDNEFKPSVEPVTIQLPFIPPAVEDESVTEAIKQEKERRKKENTDRLKALLEKKKQETLTALINSIDDYEALKAQFESQSITLDQYNKILKKGGFENTTDFEQTLLSQKRKLQRMTNDQSNNQTIEEPVEVQSFPLLNVPDSELTTDQLKEKRKQKMLAGAAEHRILQRQVKAAARAQAEERAAAEEAARARDPQSYLANLHNRKHSILERRNQRIKQSKNQSTGSRRSVTSLQRQSLLASQMIPNAQKDDRFGATDADWDVYVKAAAVQSDEESEFERNELAAIETKLQTYDPNYGEQLKAPQITEKDSQIQLYVHRIRAPELIYKPSMIGVAESGLTETIRRLLARLDSVVATSCCENVFVTGGNTLVTNFEGRLKRELTSIRPFQSKIHVYHSQDAMLDAWKGAAMLAMRDYNAAINQLNNQSINQSTELAYITRAMYDECGHDYLAEHLCSNRYFATPQLDETDAKIAKKRKR